MGKTKQLLFQEKNKKIIFTTENTDTKMSLAGKKRRSKKVQKAKGVTNSSAENNPASPTKSSKKRNKKLKKPDHVTNSSPENNPASSPTKSSKKRDKKLKKPDHVHESKGQSKALRYLKLWYSNKKCKEDQILEPWKFEKCRQIWLLQNCYSSVRVPQEDFKILPKYMSTINGRMRDGAIDDANQKVELTQKWSSLLEAGKNEAEVQKELGQPKLDDVTAKRAKKSLKS